MVVSYPVDTEDGGFRVGVYDVNGDLWWYSEQTSKDNTVLEHQACQGWLEILTDFGRRHENFPDEQSVLEVQKDIKAEIEVTKMRLDELQELIEDDSELDGSTDSSDGDDRGSSQEEEDASNQEVQPEGTEEDGTEAGSDDSGGGDEDESSGESTGSERVDGEEADEDASGETEEGDTGHSEDADQPEDSHSEVSTSS